MIIPELVTWMSEPMAIEADWMSRFIFSPEALRNEKGELIESRSGSSSGGTTAIMSIRGPLTGREGMLTSYFGYVSYEWITATIQNLVADSAVRSIVMDFDSPGGSVVGVMESADVIREARKTKKIVAISNGMMASAAYFLASQASEVVASPSSLTGAIGTIAHHVDISKMEDKFGIKTTVIASGRYKAEGTPYAPLEGDAKDRMQTMVDAYYTQFVDSVAKGRGVRSETVRNGFGQGRLLLSDEALRERLVDRIASMPDLVRSISRNRAVAQARANALDLALEQ